jgi:predicted PurR-regulated permease PerM
MYMSIQRVPVPQSISEQQQEQLVASQLNARQAWQRLWLRIQGITPSGLVRFLLVLLALGFLVWLIVSAFQSLALFLIGIMLAYISLPIVDWLDRFLPRWLATLLVILGEIALIGLFLAFFIPALIQQTQSFLRFLPSPQQLQNYFNQLAGRARGWPEPVRVFLQGTLEQTAAKVQNNFTQYIVSLLGVAVRGIVGLLTAFSFLLSLLVLPTWLFAVLNNQRRGVRLVDHLLPNWLRPDFWAVARIIDRTFRVYFRELLIMAIVVGIATYAGLMLLTRLGIPVPFPILLAMLAGFTDLIPSIGMLLGTIPAVLFGLTYSWQTALAILGLYVVIHFLRNWLLAPLFTGGSITIHSVILLVILVIASQFGLIWLFLGAPLAQVVYDLYRYAYGRVSDPPRPAGVLPGDPVPATRGRSPANRRMMVPFPASSTPQEKTIEPSRDGLS